MTLDIPKQATLPSDNEYILRAVQGFFDEEFYLADNPDVRSLAVNPLTHYLSVGWREGKNPSRAFNTEFYLTRYEDVRIADMCPLLHYAVTGIHEGRLALRPLDAERRQLEQSRPLFQRTADWASAADTTAPISRTTLATALLDSANDEGLIISVSHDDYGKSCGGIQILIADEQQMFGRFGRSYLHVSPAAPLPHLSDLTSAEAFRVRLRLDGTFLGVSNLRTVIDEIAGLHQRNVAMQVIVHHLMGHSPELVHELCIAARSSRPIVWAHDFFTLCPSFALMRNDIVYCGAPPAGSPACGVCSYGEARSRHQERIRHFFDATCPVVLAPSESALQLWMDRGRLNHAESDFLPIARLTFASVNGTESDTMTGYPLRIAHIGTRTFHKGWASFEALALRYSGDERYRFFQLGADWGPTLPGCIRNIPVSVTAEARDAMVDAIAEARIDVVVSWSLWPETFCFAAHEAMAAGVFIVARAGAGNVIPAIKSYADIQRLVLETDRELRELLEGDELIDAVNRARNLTRRGALLPEGGSARWLLTRQAKAAIGRLVNQDLVHDSKCA